MLDTCNIVIDHLLLICLISRKFEFFFVGGGNKKVLHCDQPPIVSLFLEYSFIMLLNN